ncbi:hypothetical protein Emed_001821 [Eimeria media]
MHACNSYIASARQQIPSTQEQLHKQQQQQQQQQQVATAAAGSNSSSRYKQQQQQIAANSSSSKKQQQEEQNADHKDASDVRIDEIPGPSAVGGDDGFGGTPCFKNNNPKRLVA